MMVWQLLQVRKLHDTPLILLGAMWVDLVDCARNAVLRPDGSLASAEDLAIPICCKTRPEILDVLREHHRRWSANQDAASCPQTRTRAYCRPSSFKASCIGWSKSRMETHQLVSFLPL
jgi:hypothetical protein